MIHLFLGEDIKRRAGDLEKLLKALPKNTEILYIHRNDFSPVQIESFYSGASLFSKKSVLVLSEVLEKEDNRDFILKNIKALQNSGNAFIFLERKLPKAAVTAFEKEGKVQNFDVPKEKKERFNSFLLASALERRDKLNLWITYRQAIDKGVSLEELAGVLFWKVKDMFIRKRFINFKEEELRKMIMNLPIILPRARGRGVDAEIALEKFLLEAF